MSPAAASAVTGVAAPAVLAGPVFSGFGQAAGQMGGNPSIMAATSPGDEKKKLYNHWRQIQSLETLCIEKNWLNQKVKTRCALLDNTSYFVEIMYCLP